jgi:hypothetical protein
MARVCMTCGLGMLIEAPFPIAPAEDDAFIVVDHELRVQAVARQAERLLHVRETFVVGCGLTDLLLPIGSDTQGSGLLTDAVFEAASGESMPVPAHLVLYAAADRALMLRARIGRCGPSRAALIVLERIATGRRRTTDDERDDSGEGGIRTPERGQPPLRDFQSRPFNRSGTSPGHAGEA